MDFMEFSRAYVNRLVDALSGLNLDELERLSVALRGARRIVFFGNGGSAATANHLAVDFGFCASRTGGVPYCVESLSSNASFITALGNDISYEDIFRGQMHCLGVGDVAVGISASGNSENVISALKYAKTLGCTTVGFVGFDGGGILGLVDYCIHIPTLPGEYGIVEDAHMILGHILTNYLGSKA